MLTESEFAHTLLEWHLENPRKLPFKGTRDPYNIWISEVILQQTRVEQGIPYFLRFIERFPNVKTLAESTEIEVLIAWQGLGYNSRARNLYKAANIVHRDYGGRFPSTYEEILALPGIGEYTAAAIASFAFGLSYPVVDANVLRITARLWGIDGETSSQVFRMAVREKMEQGIKEANPAEYNQAVMDFGSLVCMPGKPVCDSCPFQLECYAFQANKVDQLPRKKAKKPRRKRRFHYLVASKGEYIILRKRGTGDIWAHMYDFPLIEAEDARASGAAEVQELFEEIGCSVRKPAGGRAQYSQELSHQSIEALFEEYEFESLREPLPENYCLVNRKNLDNFAFPRLVNCYLRDKSILLD